MIILALVLVAVIVYIARAAHAQRSHRRLMMNVEHRIHVNGIRGKSSVTRLIAASLREGKIKTVAKTTGTAARMIVDHKNETPVPRKEADIVEQRRMLNQYLGTLKKLSGYQAVVFECMAINPIYQKYLENKIMHSTIGVITNVREDHTDMLGKTLPEIARSLASTVPRNGHLVTAETNEEILAILKEECDKRGTRLHSVGSMRIANSHMAKFDHFEYKSNVAIAIKVAQLAGVPRAIALKGMHKALPDPGAFKLKKVRRKKATIHWANLFAINDRESFVFTVESLYEKVGSKTKKAVILNNRHDRPERVAQFVDISVREIGADYIFTFGDYEAQVRQELKRYPDAQVTVVELGNSTKFKAASGAQLLDIIGETLQGKETILFGGVNIHTPQAQALLGVLEKKRGRTYAH